MNERAGIKLSPSCYKGDGCCEEPYGIVYTRETVRQAEADTAHADELPPEGTSELRRLRALARKIMTSLVSAKTR